VSGCSVAADLAEPLVARMRRHRYGREACIIRDVKGRTGGIVSLRTGFGGTRIVDMLVGEQLPRIC
jgi:hydrogenase expression/formation protein HypE